MLNIPDLEKRWLHYKIKSFLPYIIIFFLICIILFIYNFFNFNANNTKKTVEKKEIVVKSVYKKSAKTPPTKPIKVPVKDKSIIKLSPSMNFIHTLQAEQKPKQHFIKQKQKIRVKVKPRVEAKPIQKREISTITITRQDAAKDIQNILHRFKEDKNPVLSLFLAKKYYEIGDYKKASNYALITNQLNKKIENSWLIFAKSLVKMGKKDKAIKLLRKYINNSGSTNASILLDNIRSGEFQ